MIVKIEFNDNLTMLFGNSYKDFDEQLEEYIRINKDLLPHPVIAWQSGSKWIGWGGLKWCSEKGFQKQLDREGCQYGESDNPSPRIYKDMSFSTPSTKTMNKIIKICNKYFKAIK